MSENRSDLDGNMKQVGKAAQTTNRFSVDGIAVICVVAFAFLFFSGILINSLVYSRVALYFGEAREIATLVGGLTYLAALLVTRWKPEWLYARHISAGTLVFVLVSIFLLAFGLSAQVPLITVVALCIRAVARAWVMTLAVANLVRLKQPKLVPLVIALGLLLANLCRPLVSLFDSPVEASVVLALTNIIPIILLTRTALPILNRVRTGAPTELTELLHPGAFLKPSHELFLCVLLFATASGYAMTLNEIENAPAQTSPLAFVVLFVVVYAVAVRAHYQEDRLFSFSVLLTMAGFLMVPLTYDTESIAANTLMTIGEDAFNILLWVMFAGIGRRNLFAMLPTFGLAEFCSAVGTDIGAIVGHVSNMFIQEDPRMAVSLVLLLAFVFFVFLWVGFRRFSFSEVLYEVEQLNDDKDMMPERQLQSDDSPQPDVPPQSDDSPQSDVPYTQRSTQRSTELSSTTSKADEWTDVPDKQKPAEFTMDEKRSDKTEQFAPSDVAFTSESESTHIPSMTSVTSPLEAAPNPSEIFQQRCDELSEQYGLTEREREIFAMLARGRNARFIMEEFVLSRNTVKSHIKHIYTKMNVHSQQELIDLVEEDTLER